MPPIIQVLRKNRRLSVHHLPPVGSLKVSDLVDYIGIVIRVVLDDAAADKSNDQSKSAP